jgi:threonine dehydrogenase-like Zn-dependent dehydrogenase
MIDMRTAHIKGIRIINTSPALDAGRLYERHWESAISLFERGVFDHRKLISHRFAARDAQRAMEVSAERPADYIKGVLIFD